MGEQPDPDFVHLHVHIEYSLLLEAVCMLEVLIRNSAYSVHYFTFLPDYISF